MPPSLALPAAFFLSGAAGLIFQVVWLYRCGLVLGSSLAAVTIVLSGFMAGLAGGNLLTALFGGRARRPLRVYAALEVLVAVSGLAVTALLPHVGGLLVPLADEIGGSGRLLNAARFSVAFAMLVVPATSMGATLPLLVGALCRTGASFGGALGRLYGWNTLGAVAGVIVSEVVLIASLGVAGSAWVAAALNVCAAAIAMLVRAVPVAATPQASSRPPTPSLPTKGASRTSLRVGPDARPPLWPLFAAAALSGALLLALEVVWFRFLSMYVLVTTLATSIMLATVLTGIAAGGLLASLALRRRERIGSAPTAIACLSGVAVATSYTAFRFVTTGTQVGDWQTVMWFACVLTLPVSCLSGALFTLLGQRLHECQNDATSDVGWLTLANTAGAVLGPPVAAYVLLPHAGMEGTFFAAASGYGGVALLTVLGRSSDALRRTDLASRVRTIGAAVVLLVTLAAFPFGLMNGYFERAAAAYTGDGSTILATREGPSETLFVMQQQWLGQPVYSRLVTNGFSMSGTALQGQRYMRAFAYYPMLLHDGPLKRALVVCYGVGVTVGAVTHVPGVESIHVAEISRDVVAMSDAIYPVGSRPLDDPRVRLHIEDGRFFLQTTRERFDLITGEPPPPRTPGTVNIYTREYFQLVHDRLAKGGMATYWVPVARPHPGTDVNGILSAFCDVFRDCSLWNATPFDLMLMGSRGAEGPRTVEQFTAPWQTPGIEARLREVGFERPEQVGATFIGDASYVKALTDGTLPITDDFPQRLRPVSNHPSLSDPAYGTDAAVTRMYQSALDPSRARDAFRSSAVVRAFWPTPLIERTLPYFSQQAIINRVYWEGGRPLRQIEDLDAVLSTTTLRTLPLWLLGSDEVKQRIAETGPYANGTTEYARGLRALSGRDFAGAAQWLNASAQRGMRAEAAPLLAYALFRNGQSAEADQLAAAAATPADDDERHFWQWLRGQLGGQGH